MTNMVFKVSGNKIASLSLGENSLMFSSGTFKSSDDFNESWKKKLSITNKIEIKYDSIKLVKKEDSEKEVLIKYKSFLSIPGQCEFSFLNEDDYVIFFTFLEKERYFTKIKEVLTPFKAILNYLLGLFFAIGITVFAYYQAIEISNGTNYEATNGKTMLFNNIVGFLGEKGVLLVGTLGIVYLLYQIWKRFSNPPNQMKFLPPNS